MDRPILDKLVAEVRQFHNRDFLKAAMAVCALAAVADDEVKLSEYYRVDHVLATVPALMVLDAEKAIDTLYAYIYALRTDGPSAATVLDRKVRRMVGKRADEMVPPPHGRSVETHATRHDRGAGPQTGHRPVALSGDRPDPARRSPHSQVRATAGNKG